MTRPPASFAPIDYADRPTRVAEALDRAGCASMVLTDPVSIRWLTGFTGSAGTVVVGGSGVVLVTDRRYVDRAGSECSTAGVKVDIREALDVETHLHRVIDALDGAATVAFESDRMSSDRAVELGAHAQLVATPRLIADLRRRKGAGELVRIEAAAAAADIALARVAPQLGSMSEHEVRTELDYHLRLAGADGAGYSTIVASGPEHAAHPHHEPTHRRILDGDMVVIDVGGVVDGYRSDMTRSYVVGEPSAQQAALYALVLESQSAGLSAVAAGASAAAVDEATRAVFVEAGYADWIAHGTGHGVGLEIHERPMLSRASEEVLVAGEVVTVEPGLYRVGVGGFRIEDLVVVTDTGHRCLTHTPKESPCLPSPPTT